MFALIAVLMAIDTVIDYRQNGSIAAQTFEILVFAMALAAIGVEAWQLRSAQTKSEDVLKGLAVAIDRQFDKWELTPAERDVALLQLKGLRHKEIADLRNTSERTVRQQALSIYKKAGLSGRTDLAAFFLEDLLLPGVRHSPDAPEADAG